MVSRLALTRVSRQGKFWSQRHAAAARNHFPQTLYQIGALAAITRAQGGVCVMSNRTACYTTRRRKRHNCRRYRQSGIRLRSGIDSRRAAGSELIRAGERYGLVTREEVLPIVVIRQTVRWCREASQARD